MLISWNLLIAVWTPWLMLDLDLYHSGGRLIYIGRPNEGTGPCE